MAIEIKKKFFVSPVEAFQIVGQESFGSNWQHECAGDEDSELRIIALKNLRAALESGQVRTIWHRFDYEHELKPAEAEGEFFKIDLKRNCINLSFFAGEPIECRIHADDLTSFIRSHGEAALPTTANTLTACRKWMVARIQNNKKVSPKDYLWQEAHKKFPLLSQRSFNTARKQAIEETGGKHLQKAGRPKALSSDK